MSLFADTTVSNHDLELILVIVAILSLCIALYCGYIRDIPGAAVAIAIALILFVIAL